MQLLLTPQILKRLRRELRRAGEREIGGLLMGEQVRDEVFRVVDLSVQRAGGTEACFIRDPASHKAQLDKFFARTGGDYTRFNYLSCAEFEGHSDDAVSGLRSCGRRQLPSVDGDETFGRNGNRSHCHGVYTNGISDSCSDFRRNLKSKRAETRVLQMVAKRFQALSVRTPRPLTSLRI